MALVVTTAMVSAALPDQPRSATLCCRASLLARRKLREDRGHAQETRPCGAPIDGAVSPRRCNALQNVLCSDPIRRRRYMNRHVFKQTIDGKCMASTGSRLHACGRSR
jgi:hypothetical protein